MRFHLGLRSNFESASGTESARGAHQEVNVDLRVLCASNTDLEGRVKDGTSEKTCIIDECGRDYTAAIA